MRISSLFLVAALTCVGCGGDMDDDAGVMPGMDAGGGGTDAGGGGTDAGLDDDGGTMGTDAGPGDDGGAMGTDAGPTDAGPAPTDAGGCTPITEDASKIGMTCSPDGVPCDTGYTCEELHGIVRTFFCQIVCSDDCDCPGGTTCQPFSDKSGTRHFCQAP
ncbi:MAG: hypothetical protein KC619_09050 [Myxococcales bacterium]|nr:hypothetical protein [Myxococcales bacterium]